MTDLGPALILAGPGSGKTHVLTHHIKYLIENGALPGSIMVITFTKAAALEMRHRFTKLLPSAANQTVFGTFHSVFYRLLKIFKPETPDIIPNNKRSEILDEITGNTDLSELLSNRISLYKSLADKDSFSFCNESEKELFLLDFERYTKKIRSLNYFDFDDILYEFYKMISEDESVLESIRNQFKYVCLDEFQDINEIQYETITFLFDHTQNIYAVGDEDQAIYGFRGASPGIMKRYIDTYEKIKLIELENNYRSKGEIVEKAHIVISKNPGRLSKNIQKCQSDSPDSFKLFVYKTREKELLDFIKDVRNVPQEKSCAVLLRTNQEVKEFRSLLGIYDNGKLDNLKDEVNKIFYSYLKYSKDKDHDSLLKIINYPERQLPFSMFKKGISINDQIKQNSGTYKGQILSVFKMQTDILSKLSPYSAFMYILNVINLKGYFYEKYEGRISELEIILNGLNNAANESKNIIEFMNLIQSQINNKDILPLKNIFVSTFHQSKGLEYDVVFLPDVYEGKVPSGLSVLECNVEEERRLFYVAMTRAKEKLYIYTLKNEESGGHMPSRFIRDFI